MKKKKTSYLPFVIILFEPLPSPHLKQTPFENIVAKEAIAHNGQWFLLLQIFSTLLVRSKPIFSNNLILCIFAFNLEKSKICLWG